jgi:hypothetical protein
MKFTQKLKESTRLFGTPKKEHVVKSTHKLALGTIEQDYGVYALPTYKDQVQTFYEDPVLREGILNFCEQALSTGIYITGNPDYNEKLNGKSALDVINEWCDLNNVDLKAQEQVVDLRAFGNSVWYIPENLGFIKIPTEALWHAVAVDKSIPLQYKYAIMLTAEYKCEIFKPEEYIHFRQNVTGYNAPFGMGIMYGLLARPVDRYGITCPSIYDIRLSMRGSLDEGFRKFSFGNVWIGVPDMSNEDFDASGLGDKVSKMKSTGNRIVTNSKVEVALEVPQRTQSYDQFIKEMRDEFFMAVADPSLKLGLEQGFTKATSETASEMYKFKIANSRMVLKQQYEDLFKIILKKSGYDPLKAQIKMNFGPEENPVYEIKDIFTAVDKQVIDKDEARKLLVNYFHWELTGKAPLEKEKEDPNMRTILKPNRVDVSKLSDKLKE